MEVVKYSVSSADNKTVSQVAEQALKNDPQVNEQAIATQFRVITNRIATDPGKVQQALDRLRKLTFPPYPGTFVTLDERSIYDYWFDSGGEVTHFSFFDAAGGSHEPLQDWMVELRALFSGASR